MTVESLGFPPVSKQTKAICDIDHAALRLKTWADVMDDRRARLFVHDNVEQILGGLEVLRKELGR